MRRRPRTAGPTSPPSTSARSSTRTPALRAASGCASRPSTTSASPASSAASGSGAATRASPKRRSSPGWRIPPASARPAAGCGTTARRPSSSASTATTRPCRAGRYRRAGGLLRRRRAPIRRELFRRERGLPGIPGAVVLCDLANVHCRGRRDGALPRFGRSKRKRRDCPPVALALALDAAGFPRCAEILPGNASGPETLRHAPERLEAECGPGGGRPAVAVDAGIAGKERRRAAACARGCGWTAAGRGEEGRPLRGAPPKPRLDAAARHEVAGLAPCRGGRRSEALHAVSEGGKAAGDSILEAGSGPVSRRRSATSPPRPPGQGPAQAVRQGPGERGAAQAALLPGRRPVRDQPSRRSPGAPTPGPFAMPARKAWRRRRRRGRSLRVAHQPHRLGHRDAAADPLADHGCIEATFRSLRNRSPGRGRSTIIRTAASRPIRMVSVFAFHAAQPVRARLKARGIDRCWKSIREGMRTWMRITTRLAGTDGTVIISRQDTRPGAGVAEMAMAAGVEPAPPPQADPHRGLTEPRGMRRRAAAGPGGAFLHINALRGVGIERRRRGPAGRPHPLPGLRPP